MKLSSSLILMHKLAILTVIINFEKSDAFFKSLNAQTDINFHLYIADISGSGATPKIPFKNITILKRENNGYAYGINEGIRQAQRDGLTQFCVINDDVFFEKDFVANVKKSLAAHPGSIVGGKIYYAPGHEYHKDRYSKKDLGHVLWYAGGSIDWAHAQTTHRGVDEADTGHYNTAEPTGFVTGCLMAFDKTLTEKIGLLDQSYFLYFEDTDYCMRATRAGLKLYYDPSIVIWHMVSQSTGGSGSSTHVKYQRRNLVKFALRYAPLRTKFHVLKNYLFPQFQR